MWAQKVWALALASFGAQLAAEFILRLAPSHSVRSWRLGGFFKPAPLDHRSLFLQFPHVAVSLAHDLSPSTQVSDSAARNGGPPKICRKDYKPYDFLVHSVDLTLKLDEESTQVNSVLLLSRRHSIPPQDLVLDGEELQLEKVLLNRTELAESQETGYSFTDDGKMLISKEALPVEDDVTFELQVSVIIHPKRNLELSGLYVSEGILITQCESTGFRRITYFPDRPDVLSRYRVRIEADATRYPVLLSNGDKVEEGPLDGAADRHYAIFDDPHPKPSYLFAVVAGQFGVIKDSYKTMSGREVTLQLFSSPDQVDKLDIPRKILRDSMRWDEETFGLEYDLQTLNMVCVNDFNAGAMENKGLLIFNCDAFLADPKTTPDLQYTSIVSTVAHEYFHNWTGNRVTIRDWSDLTLKEGLTTFREDWFSATVDSAAVKRIETVKTMLVSQFREDASPLAHPIRPECYGAVDNLYTSTVYSKGAEVIRMYHTILGEEGFRKGMDLYFERHDGKAVTSEDFLAAMADANTTDLSQFGLWYSQAGTPVVRAKTTYNPKLRTCSLELSQYTPPTPGQHHKQPLLIPVKVGLIGKTSKRDLLDPPTKVVLLTQESQTVIFFDINEECVASILRDFSAPVKLIYEKTPEELAFRMAHDSDPVNKWFAAQELASSIILSRADEARHNITAEFAPLPRVFVDALRTALLDDQTENSVKALTLRLPELQALEQEFRPVDPTALFRARRSVIVDLASALKTEMVELYEQLTVHEQELFDKHGIGRRRLRNELLRYLSEFRDREAAERAYTHFIVARCMSDKFYALLSLNSLQHPEREAAFERFYAEANGNAQVVGHWFRLKSSADLPDQVERVSLLQDHPAFSFANPNLLSDLFITFVSWSYVHFHRKDGAGYKLLADAVLKVDKFNTAMAARLARTLNEWRHYTEDRQVLMKHELRRILSEPGLSKNVMDVVSTALIDS